MQNSNYKRKKTSEDLVEMLENEKGVSFSIMSKVDAVSYLTEKNNYFRTAGYRKNYATHKVTTEDGSELLHYTNLEFAYLAELSTIDMMLRGIFLKMSIDVEHALKVTLLADMEKNSLEDDGYDAVSRFIKKHPKVLISIKEKKLFQKYAVTPQNTSTETCPIWVFVELISFGDTTLFLNHYQGIYTRKIVSDHVLDTLNAVRMVRNACAHNNNLLYYLHKQNKTKPKPYIEQYIKNISNVSTNSLRKKLKTRAILDIVSLLYVYDNVVPENMKKRRYLELKSYTTDEMQRHFHYFDKNDVVKSALEFLIKVVDNLPEV